MEDTGLSGEEIWPKCLYAGMCGVGVFEGMLEAGGQAMCFALLLRFEFGCLILIVGLLGRRCWLRACVRV